MRPPAASLGTAPPAMQLQDTLVEASVVVDSVITTADLEPAAADTAATLADETSEAVATLQDLAEAFVGFLPKLAIALFVALLFVFVARGVRGIVHRVTPGPIDSNIGIVLGRLAYALMVLSLIHI